MKKFIIILLVLTLTVSSAACRAVDVIGKYSVTSFDAVLNSIPDKIAFDEANNAWSLTSPSGERFLWGRDLMLEFDSEPFIKAGLDISKLPEETHIYDDSADKLMIRAELGGEKFTYDGEASPLRSFRQLVETHRDNIGYHGALDHYGVDLGGGNMFEWAKDMGTNDKDIVFVLDPQPFIDAGVDPSKIEGWAFAKVEIMDDRGNKLEVDKLLKPFDLK